MTLWPIYILIIFSILFRIRWAKESIELSKIDSEEQDEEKESPRIFSLKISNISSKSNKDSFHSLFQDFPNILSIQWKNFLQGSNADLSAGQKRFPFVLIQFTDPSSAALVMRQLDGRMFYDQPLQ